MAFSYRQQEGYRLVVAFTAQVNLAAKAPSAVSQRLALPTAIDGPCRMLMSSNYTAYAFGGAKLYDIVQCSVKLPSCICLLLQALQNLLPASALAPSIKASRYRFPGSIAIG